MQVSSFYDMENILGVDAISNKKYSRVQEVTKPSGDTVDISEDAKKLYSEMIHKYDKSASTSADREYVSDSEGDTSEESSEGGAVQGGGSDGSNSSDSSESIKKQIQSLKSQMAALVSQMGSGGDAGATAKINSLQAQIAALEAQLSEMESV